MNLLMGASLLALAKSIASTLLEKKPCRLVINDFRNKSELNWELHIKGG